MFSPLPASFRSFDVSARALGLVLLVLVPARTAAAAPEAPVVEKAPSGKFDWVQSLLPNAWQKNPRLNFTVVTEMTEAGKKLPPVSAAQPVYFQLHSSGFQQLGDAPAGEKTVKKEQLEKTLLQGLAANGYLPAKPPEHPPSLLIVYGWGSHNTITESLSNHQIARNLLDRTALVGGEKFAQKVQTVFREAETFAAGLPPPPRLPGFEPIISADAIEFMNPVNQFKMVDRKNEFLLNQASENIYFVVASAYDLGAVAERRRVLLWRTRMTVTTQGVTQEQTLPTLVLTAAPFYGKETNGAEIIARRTVREGSVELGTPTVVESPAAPPPAPADSRKK
ncbi:MAG: hypothetical protein ABIR80_18120 [Opitutaceae bacterium]